MNELITIVAHSPDQMRWTRDKDHSALWWIPFSLNRTPDLQRAQSFRSISSSRTCRLVGDEVRLRVDPANLSDAYSTLAVWIMDTNTHIAAASRTQEPSAGDSGDDAADRERLASELKKLFP